MLVRVCAPGTETPETDGDGAPLPPLKLLIGGVPARTKWYPFDPVNGDILSGGFERDAIRDGALLIPVETFSTDNAPFRKEFAVFVNGERLKYPDYPELFVVVAKATDGRIVSFNGRAYDHCLREFKLPKGAILVPTGDFPDQWDFKVLGCIGIPEPRIEQRVALEKLGVVFFDHAPFGHFSFHNYSAVCLPPGWQVVERGPWYLKCSFDIEIWDTKKRPIARIHQKPREYALDTTWTGTITLV